MVAYVLLATAALAVSTPVGSSTAAASVPATGPLNVLRAERSVLLPRIAQLTDDASRARARSLTAQARQRQAQAAAEDARLHVARWAVDAYVDGVQATDSARVRRNGWADAASATTRYLFGLLQGTRRHADAEAQAAAVALDNVRRATESLQKLRAQLEATIAYREKVDAASSRARLLATGGRELSTTPRFARSTRAQGELYARFPFGLVASAPEGLAPTGQVVTGRASWYGPGFDGRPTASGAIFDQTAFTVASKELPLGTILMVHFGDRSALVLVNDRGPYVAGRVLDFAHAVAVALGTVHAGVAQVTAEVMAPTA